MPFNNTRKEKLQLQNRLEKVLETRRLPLARLHDLYRQWARERGLPFASRETLDNWLHASFAGGNNPDWDEGRAAALHDFLESNFHDNETQALVHLLEKRFHAPFAVPHDYLKSLCGGLFAMYRPLWSKPESGLFIRSIVTFREDDGLILYEEKQDYFDPVKEVQRKETDSGVVLVFGFNLYILSRGQDVNTLKFLVIHDTDPHVNGEKQTSICRGNMLAVVGRGPHPGFRFLLKRIADDDLESRVVEESALDADTRNYLTG